MRRGSVKIENPSASAHERAIKGASCSIFRAGPSYVNKSQQDVRWKWS